MTFKAALPGRFILPLVIACAALVSHADGAAAQAPKPPDGIAIAVEAGAGGVIHMGRVNPFTVFVENERETDFYAAVEISSEGIAYRRDVKIAPGDQARIRLYVDLDQPKRDLSLFLKDARDRTIYQAAIELKNSAAPEDALILIADAGSGVISFLDGTPVLSAKKTVLDNSQVFLQQGKFRTSYATLAHILDGGPQYLASVDALVIRSGDFSRISSENLAAIQGFVAAGGALVTTAGVDSPKLAQSRLAEILPAPQPSFEPLTDLSGLESLGGAKIQGSPVILAGHGGAAVPGAEILASSGGRTLIAARDYGLGRIAQINLDVGEPHLRAWSGWERVWSRILLPALARPGLDEISMPKSRVAEMVKDIPQTDPVPLRTATLFIFVYIVLVGPVNYALLAKRKRRTLLWATIPFVVIAFTMFGVMLGYFSRGTENILRQIEEIHVFEGVPVALVRSYTLDFPSASGLDRLSFDNASATIRTVDPPPPYDRYGHYSYGRQTATEIAPRRISYAPAPSVERRSNKWTSYLTWWDGIADAQFGSVSVSQDGTAVNYEFDETPVYFWLMKDARAQPLNLQGASGTAKIANTPNLPSFREERTISSAVRDLVFFPKEYAARGISGRERAAIYAYFYLARPVVNTSRNYRTEAGRIVAFYPSTLPISSSWAQTQMSVIGFASKSGTPSQSRGYSYGYETESNMAVLDEGDMVELQFKVTPMLESAYTLRVNAIHQDRWSSQGVLEFEYEISSGSSVISKGKASGQLDTPIQASDVSGGTVYLRITAAEKLVISSLALTPGG